MGSVSDLNWRQSRRQTLEVDIRGSVSGARPEHPQQWWPSIHPSGIHVNVSISKRIQGWNHIRFVNARLDRNRSLAALPDQANDRRLF